MSEMVWQPIETAPKDKTPILVHCKNRATYAVWWSDVDERSLGLEPGWLLVGGGDLARKTSDARTPTHWMHLPPPPTAQGEHRDT